MQAGKNRKRDLKLLTEVYSSHLLGEGLRDYDPAQQQGGSQQARMAPNMGTETHTGAVQSREDQNAQENYEDEEETLQEMSGRMLTRKGWKKSEVTGQGNWVFTKADQPDAHVGTDGLINGKDYKLFFTSTGEDPGTEEAEENDQSTPEPEDTGVNADENRGSWGSAAFGNESEESHEDHEAMLIGRRSGGCGDNDDRHGSSDPTHNPRALGGMVDIIAKAISDQNEDAEDEIEDDDMLMRHHKKMADTDLSDERYFKRRDKQENDAAKKQGFDPDENAEDGAAKAHKAEERENRKNLSAQDIVAKLYGFNPDENQEDLPWPKEIDADKAFDHNLGADTDAADKKEFKGLDSEEWEKAEQAGWKPPGRMKHKYPFDPENEEYEDKDEKKESYFKSKADKAMTQLMESYQSVVKGNHGQIL
tara:strand:+ start:2970 stop:4229 length:1260 start_codon:yes stop_codon:yes gene_type:complete